MSESRSPFDPRLAFLVVAGITGCFVLVVVASIITGRQVDAELYGLMGIVAGGVLGYGVLRK